MKIFVLWALMAYFKKTICDDGFELHFHIFQKYKLICFRLFATTLSLLELTIFNYILALLVIFFFFNDILLPTLRIFKE
jgi:hypothetical protein